MNFGEVLKRERTEQHLSLGELERRSGVRKGTISRIEKGDTKNPGGNTLQSLAKALGKKPSIFFGSEVQNFALNKGAPADESA
jgi:transcriptional regulator with XRE-family HTH domain